MYNQPEAKLTSSLPDLRLCRWPSVEVKAEVTLLHDSGSTASGSGPECDVASIATFHYSRGVRCKVEYTWKDRIRKETEARLSGHRAEPTLCFLPWHPRSRFLAPRSLWLSLSRSLGVAQLTSRSRSSVGLPDEHGAAERQWRLPPPQAGASLDGKFWSRPAIQEACIAYSQARPQPTRDSCGEGREMQGLALAWWLGARWPAGDQAVSAAANVCRRNGPQQHGGAATPSRGGSHGTRGSAQRSSPSSTWREGRQRSRSLRRLGRALRRSSQR